MKLKYLLSMIAVQLFCTNQSFGYGTAEPPEQKIGTHETITMVAYYSSILAQYINNGQFSEIGLPDVNLNGKKVLDWLQKGAHDEDHGLGLRFLNHFYNPIVADDEAGLSRQQGLCSPIKGRSSLEWALEPNRDIQAYSYQDAKTYYKEGLTSKGKKDRDKNLANTFEAIGHVIHLIQDISVPLHVRDDPHPTWLCGSWQDRPLYEKLTQDYLNQGIPLPFNGYDVVYSQKDTQTFNSPKKFWKNPQASRPGLAEFTNHNFVSAGTNFDQNPQKFAFPKALQGNFVSIQNLCSNANPPCTTKLTGEMVFIPTLIESQDVPPGTYNQRASTHSLFDADLENKLGKPLYTLNRFNFVEAHQFLIPRAVGYSAGLINYFFRGSIAIDAKLNEKGDVIVTNSGSEDMNGTFSLYYDDANDERNPVSGASGGLAIQHGGGTGSLGHFTPPTSPPPKEPGKYILVFEGSMGSESDAVAGRIVILRLHDLTVSIVGVGSGKVESNPLGIICGNTCKAAFIDGKPVILTATEDPGSTFAGWSGDCSDTQQQTTVVMDKDRHCTATFSLLSDGVFLNISLNQEGTPPLYGNWKFTVKDLNKPPSPYAPNDACWSDTTLLFTIQGYVPPIPIFVLPSLCILDPNANTYRYYSNSYLRGSTAQLTANLYAPQQCWVYGNFFHDIWGRKEWFLEPCSYPLPEFIGWSGDCSGVGMTTSVEMTQDKNCVATIRWP